jgi:hypothetical protein
MSVKKNKICSIHTFVFLCRKKKINKKNTDEKRIKTKQK